MIGKNFERMINEFFYSDPFFNNGDNYVRKNYTSEDGKISFTYITNKRGGLEKQDEITLLNQKLNIAVDEQNFEEAATLRDKIKKLEENKNEIKTLSLELEKCIKNQDFENAILLRDKLKSLK